MTETDARATKRAEGQRDAARSRKAILDAAERLFAERGFEGASLGEIGAAAGLSRATPSYFFGGKEALHRAVLERAFAAREEATRSAFEQLQRWSRGDSSASLEAALADAVAGYTRFLLGRPTFARLIQWEEMGGAERLRRARRQSQAIEDAFRAVRRVAPERGLSPFAVGDAVFLFVSLTYWPLMQGSTFMAALGRDLGDPATARRHAELAVSQLLHLLGATGAE